MNRKIIQDIIPRGVAAKRQNQPEISAEPPRFRGRRDTGKRGWRPVILVLAGLAVILGLFLLFSSYYSRASIKIVTTRKVVDLDEQIILDKNGSDGGVKYELMKFKETQYAYVPITGSKVVSKYATGVVTIYNSYNTASQDLIVGTRLETKDGKIYKIAKSVVVPGLISQGGKDVPGEVSVSVKAIETGIKYNIPPSDFTIPGFKNSPKYLKISGRSSSDITGGWSGELKAASSLLIQKARQDAEVALRDKLIKSAAAQVPKGYIFYTDAAFISFSDNTIDNALLIGADGDKKNLQINGTLNAILIPEDSLKSFLVSKKQSELGTGTNLVVRDIDKLNLAILNKDKLSLNGNDIITTRLTGKLPVVWDIDDNSLKNKLVAIGKADYQNVFKEFPAIEKAEVVFSPSWALYFPSDPARIEIDKGIDFK